MDARITARLDQLRNEFQGGEKQLREIQRQESAVRETLLRISGAIQVLEELSAAAPPSEPNGTERPAKLLTVP